MNTLEFDTLTVHTGERVKGLAMLGWLRCGWLGALVVGLAGCGSTEECSQDSDCAEGQVCRFDECVVAEPPSGGGGDNPDNPDDPDQPGPDPQPSGPDTEGPIIIIRSPAPFQVLRGLTTVIAEIVDTGVGLDPQSPQLILGDRLTVPLERTDGATQFFEATVNLDEFRAALSLAVEVTAADLNGNESVVGNSFILDYAGPLLDLEPAPIRPYFNDTQLGTICGAAVEQLGDTSLRNGTVINPGAQNGLAFFARAEIVDRATGGPYAVPAPSAGIDDATAILVLLDQDALGQGRRLLSSSVDGGRCDRIHPDVIPRPIEDPLASPIAVVQTLVRTFALGFPDLSSATLLRDEPMAIEGPPPEPCDLWPTDIPPELGLSAPPFVEVCPVVDPSLKFFRLTPTLSGERLSQVFVLNAYDSTSDLLCSGAFFDSFNLVENGPACVAAFAADEVGNTAVSRPLYICIDRNNSGACAGFDPTPEEALAACTDGCGAPIDRGSPTDTPIPVNFTNF